MIDENKNPWKTLSVVEKYENPWIKVSEFQVLNPAGKPGIYGQVSFKNYAIGVIPLTEDGYTWLVGQYRYTLNQYSWEICEGGCLIGEESKEEAAQRELLEETGIVAGQLEPLLTLHTSNSVTNEVAFIYLATNLSFTEAEPEETEELALKKVHLSEAIQMIQAGIITDALSVAGLLMLQSVRGGA